ncbi:MULTISPECIES: GAF domain-containing sensor histidine kinase [unclassified Leptolyngbya]|uniref:sensor histidine kinase n=1 Tax=unclassified Leptolyngbya TaxID=2650499 RepID=UPI0016843D14|nr:MULTISPECIES: GAF domain-containing sensor histidine kinase [unclassified Leptolyngbya]MBD1911529.1 GAF domain-containing sensor histidine kinase [Leptolyngbya sp. FACHB-8]MBD2155563.1 GAF domain-containing sensor histidine kinase [Leptolyngbya sp. FACHB-16]
MKRGPSQVRLRVLALVLYGLVLGNAMLSGLVPRGAIALILLLELGFQPWVRRWIQEILKLVEAVTHGNFDIRLKECSGLQELESLNEAVNQMLSAIVAHQEQACQPAFILPAEQSQHIQNLQQHRQAAFEMALQKQIARETLIHKVSQRIRRSLNLPVILQTTVEEVQQFLDADRVLILQYESPCRSRVLVEQVREGYSSLSDTLLYAPLLSLSTASSGAVQAIADLEQADLPENHVLLLLQFEIKAYVTVPIWLGDHPWGLVMAHQCRQARQWQAWEIEFLQELSTSVAIAIHQANLYDQVQQLNSELAQQVQAHTAQLQEALDFEALLKRITDRVRDSLDESQILQSVVQELAQGLGVGSCLTATYDLATHTVIPQYEYTTFFSSISHRVMPLAQSSSPYQQLLCEQYLHYCEYHPIWGRISLLVCPILDDQGVLGELRLATFANRTFDELQIRVAQQVANQCAIAIRQARLYQSAQRQVQELERLNQLKDDFLSTVSHELRTPMANIRMAMQMMDLLLKQAELPEHISLALQQYLGVLEMEGDREMALINDLLEFSCLDAKTEPILPTCIELKTWLSHLSEAFTARLQAQNQTLTIQVADSVGTVAIDLSHLEHILMELFNNACKYTPPGEGIAIAAHADTSTLHISVINAGVEIQTTEFERVFEKFYRIPNGDPWKHGGTGLGLALVKKRVTYLGGAIEVTSTHERTIFTIHLPLNPAACCNTFFPITQDVPSL